MDSLEAAALRSGRGTKTAADGISDLGSSSAKASKDLTNTSEAVGGLADASTSASKTVAGAASNLGDLGSISSSASKNLQDTSLVIGDIAGGSTAASGSIKSTAGNLADLSSISSTAGSNLQNTNLVIGDIAGGSTAASASIAGASDSLNNMGGSADNAADATRRAAQETESVNQQSSRASISIKDLAVSLGLVALASKAFNVLKSSLDSAISRFDTLAGFPVVMERMGFSSDQAKDSIEKLSNGIQGLPTTLDGIVASTQNIATLTGDLEGATDTALALNNAFLASGSSAANAERGLTQYVQMLSKGSVDIMSWRTLQETMGYALKETAKEFGFTGVSAQNDLYAALKDGDIVFKDFNAKLIELNEGVGGFADMAVTGSAGIATSFGNLKNAVTVGAANIITSFEKLSQETTGKTIAQNLDGLKVVVKSSFKVIGSVIEGTAPIVIAFASAVQATIPVVQTLTPAIVGLMAAYAAYTVITKAKAAIDAANATLAIAQASTTALTVITKAKMAALIADTTATTANTVATVAQTGAVTLSTLAIGLMTGKVSFATVAIVAKTVATYAWGAAVKFLMGPIGWITVGIGLLVAGVIAVVKWFKKSTEEAERLNGVTESLGESTNALNESVTGSSSAFEKNQGNIKATAQANTDLITKIEELLAVEHKSGAVKKELQSYVDSLNGSVDGLSLAYSKEADSLNLSSEEIAAKINLMKEQETLMASQERFLEISKEQAEVDMKLTETNALREEWNQKLADGSIKTREHKAAIAELDEQETLLTTTTANLAAQQLETEQQVTASIAAVTEATKNSVDDQVIAYEFLSDSQKDAVDSMKSTWEEYKSAATDMFDKLSEKSKVSIGDMTKNLEENQRVITNWSENIAKLAERGIDEGLLNTLRDAGPESAGHVNALVKASDDELKKLSTAFSNGGDVAASALSKSLGIENSGVMEAVGHLVTQTGDSVKKQIEAADFKSIGSAVPEGLVGGIDGGTKDVEKATQDMAKATEEAARKELEINSPSKVFEKIGEGLPEGLVLGVSNGTNDVIKSMQKLSKSSVEQFKNTPSQFEGIGKDTMAGLNRGLTSGEAQVVATARRIANSAASEMRKALDIHSPSRVTTKIGEQTGQGVVDGLGSKQKAVNDTAFEMAKTVIELTKKMQKEVKTETSKHNEEIKSIEKRAAQDINLINAKATKGKRDLTQVELVRVQRITENANKKIVAIEQKTANEREKIAKENNKLVIDLSEKYVKQKKADGEMSLKDEVYFWNEMKTSTKVGSEEYEKSLQNHQNAVKKMRSEMEAENENYAKRVVEIDKKLVDDTKKLNEEYNQVYSKRVNDLLNIVGLLDEFVEKDQVAGYQLIHNMQSQVNALEEFSTVIGSLGDRIDNDALFEELQALGPKSIAELRALNSMSDDELQQFAGLYEKRFELARTQASKELEPLKEDITQQIKNLNEASQEELLLVEKEWKKAINKIVLGTQKEFDSMNQVGKDAMRGLEGGILSMESSLMATARRIADSIKATMQSALDIHSPSRVMRDEVGKMIPAGIALGIKENAKMVYKELEALSAGMITPATPEQALGTSRMAYNGSGAASNGNTFTTNNDQSRLMENKITINTTDSGVKEMERTLRRWQFGF